MPPWRCVPRARRRRPADRGAPFSPPLRPDHRAPPPPARAASPEGTACLWQEYHAEGDAAKAVVSGSEKNGRVEPGGPDDSAELPSCDETQWANNPDGGRPELRRFENGEPVANATIDGNGTFNGKYTFWPDCEDFETDIETTCAGLGRDFCPYQPLQSSVLCEWKAKGATNWMTNATFNGAGTTPANKGSAGDWLRMGFHDAGQFFVDDAFGRGDDGSLWYEVNKKTANPIWRPNFEMAAQTFDTRKKVYRPLNRCGATPSEACRYPCEELCEYKDETLFPHFNPDGSVSVPSKYKCYSSSSSDPEPADPGALLGPEEEPGGLSTFEAQRSGFAGATSSPRPRARAASVDRPKDSARTTGAAGSSSRSSGGAARGLLQQESSSRFHHHHNAHHSRPPGAFASWLGRWDPYGRWKNAEPATCYSSCKSSCEDWFLNNSTRPSRIRDEMGFDASDSRGDRVQCVVPFADALQYAAASAVEVTGGPKLVRDVRPGRCDASGPDPTIILPSPHTMSVKDMLERVPFFAPCHCGGEWHLTAISGAHTLGHAHSRRISAACENLIEGSTERSRNMDTTPFTFDNEYWRGLVRATCEADQRSWHGFDARGRPGMREYPTCTKPYLTDDWAKQQTPPWREFANGTDGVDRGGLYERSLFYDTMDASRESPAVCVNVTSSNENTCSNTTCGPPSGCATLLEVAKCACDPCDHDDVTHCTAAATCGTFHSDHMLWATRETAAQVRRYADDQGAFFADYARAHLRMAHVGCEPCGGASDHLWNRCAAPTHHRHKYRRAAPVDGAPGERTAASAGWAKREGP